MTIYRETSMDETEAMCAFLTGIGIHLHCTFSPSPRSRLTQLGVRA